MIRLVAFFYCSLISFYVFAESTLPVGCQAVAVQGEAVTLEAKKRSLVFIHNLTTTDLWITHPTKSSSANSGWTTRLQVDKWSALALKKGFFTLNCIESTPGHEQQIPCEGAIAVCQWNVKGIKIPNQKTTSWASENRSLDGLIAALGAQGFIIPLASSSQ